MSSGIPGYGNWRKPRTNAVWGLPLLGVAAVLCGGVTGMALMIAAGLAGLLATLAIFLPLIGLVSIKTKSGYALYEHLGVQMAWWKAKLKGTNTFVSGAASKHGTGTASLPGLAAPTNLLATQDSLGNTIAVIEHARMGLYTMIFEAHPDGLSLVDQDTIDTWVARWGNFLADLGHETGLEGAAVTVETSPDTGEGLRRAILPRIDQTAPALAQNMLREVVDTYPAGSASTIAYITLTWNAQLRPGAKRRPRDMVLRDIASRCPGLLASLQGTGAGNVSVLTPTRLTHVIRSAYDPAWATIAAESIDQGYDITLTWNDVGPISAKATWDTYIHDGARSVTWEMVEAPTGVVRADILTNLLAPHPELQRKRVTLLYRPFEAGRAARKVDADQRMANMEVTSAHGVVSARKLKNLADAQKTALDEAAGAGLEDFALLVTVTAGWDNDYREITGIIESLSATSRCRLRRCWGQQDSAFALALPLGIVPSKYDMTPQAMKELL